MSAFEDHKEELEHYEQMFGRERGRLAVSLDRLTNALVLVGQHGVYCTSQRNPTLPAMDIRSIANELTHAKELVQSVMEELRRTKDDARNRKVCELVAGDKKGIRLPLFADARRRPMPGMYHRLIRQRHQLAAQRVHDVFHGPAPQIGPSDAPGK